MTQIESGEVRDAIAKGLAWRVSKEFSLGAGLTKIFGFITGSYATGLEARDLASTGENTLFLLYEDISYTGGTLIQMQNRNRFYQSRTDLNPLTEFREDVTATPAGNPVTGARLLFSNKGVVSVGSDSDSSFIQLKANTSHIITTLNSDSQTATISFGALLRRVTFVA